MKIAFYCPRGAGGAGGLGRAADDLQRELVGAGIDVSAMAPGDRFPACDILHFHGIWQSAYLKATNLPYVVSPHGMLEPWSMRHKAWKKWPYFYLRERRFLRKSRFLFATGQMESDNLSHLLPNHPLRLAPLGPSGANSPAYQACRRKLGWGADTSVLLYLSRIHPKKGLDLLLHALREMPEARRAKTLLVIVGGGDRSYLDRIKEIARRYTSDLPQIVWKGEILGDEKWCYLEGADLFCLPTHSENFGLAVLEAAQVGTPVLTTDRTPWAEYRGRPGFYIASPEINSIREQLLSWFNQEPWTLADREALSDRVKASFNWKLIVQVYIKAYREILGLSA